MFQPKPDLIYTDTDNQNNDDNSPVSPLSPITPPYRSDSTSPVPPLRLQASTSAVTKSKRNFDSEKTVIEDPAHTPTYDLSYYFHVQPSSDDIQNNIYRERSSSIGSSVSSAHIVPVIPSHRHKAEQYKQKAEKSHQKAHQFFGEQVQLEISAREIKKEGLKALLYSKVPLGYFLYHLLQEYSSENLFFYLAVDKYENYLFPSEGEQEEAAEKISKTYLTRNAELEINLEDKITRSVKQALKRQKATCASTGNEFDTAKRHVFSLLSVSYHGFRTSAVWDIMESKCANLNIYNRDRSQGLIVNLLLSHFKKRPTLTANSQQNNTPRDAIESMVNTFCQNFLPYGLRYREMQQWEPIMKRADSVGNKSRPRSKSTGNEKKPNNGFASKFDIFGKKLARK